MHGFSYKRCGPCDEYKICDGGGYIAGRNRVEARRIALSLGLLAVTACAVAAKPAPTAVGHRRADTVTTIVVPAGKRGTVEIPVTVDRSMIDTSGAGNPRSIQVVGQRGDTIVEVLDAYPSKPQGMARCRSGTETYFRVLDTVARRQRFARLVDSCRDDRIHAADPLITRSADGSEVTLHGLYSRFTVRIGVDGAIVVLP